jgi:hypothetical protein
MTMFVALLGAAGLVALSLPAHAVGSATVEDAPLVKSNTAQHQQFAQRPYDPSAGSVGFKKSKKKYKAAAQPQSSGTGPTNPNPNPGGSYSGPKGPKKK